MAALASDLRIDFSELGLAVPGLLQVHGPDSISESVHTCGLQGAPLRPVSETFIPLWNCTKPYLRGQSLISGQHYPCLFFFFFFKGLFM